MAATDTLARLVIAYAIVVAPALGLRRYRHLLAGLRADDPRARVRFYQHTLLIKAALAMAALVWMRSAPEAQPLQYPHTSTLTVAPTVVGLLVGLAGSVVYYRRYGDRKLRRLLGMAGGIFPRTPRERLWFWPVCVAVGTSEELVYRWLWMSYLLLHLEQLGYWGCAAAASLAFGLGHLYQGWRGVFGTTLVGFLLLLCWLYTGSLWIAIVTHIGLDARLALIMTPKRFEQLEGNATRS